MVFILQTFTVSGDFQFSNSTIINAYYGVDIHNGRQYVTNVYVGALQTAFQIIDGADIIVMDNIHTGAGAWDGFLGYAFPQNLDQYCVDNLTTFDVGRADGFQFNNINTFWNNIGFNFHDQAGTAPVNAYGAMQNITIDSPIYGIICQSTRGLTSGGILVSNLIMLAQPSINSDIGIWMRTGGSQPPILSVVNGAVRPGWITGAYKIDAGLEGNLNVSSVMGIDLGAGALSSPAVPLSTVALVNPFPFRVQVAVSGGTITVIKLDGVDIGTANFNGPYTVATGGSIAITYSAPPTWKWFAT